MIVLTKDLFVALANSAKALEEEKSNSIVNASLSKGDFSPLEKSSYDAVDVDSSDMQRTKKVMDEKPIEETVEDLINNPEVKELKNELDKVEEIFFNMREKGQNLDVMFRIEKRIEDLKRMIDQRSYV